MGLVLIGVVINFNKTLVTCDVSFYCYCDCTVLQGHLAVQFATGVFQTEAIVIGTSEISMEMYKLLTVTFVVRHSRILKV